jgi:hypothetical protein
MNSCAAVTWTFQFSIWAGDTGPFDSFVLLNGQEGARYCEVASNPSSWFWVHSILCKKRNILSCMKPRTKSRLRERGFLLGQFLRHLRPRRHSRRRIRLCFDCDAVTPTWQGTVWNSAPETEFQWIACTETRAQWLQYRVAACIRFLQPCASTSQAQKNQWKLRYQRS